VASRNAGGIATDHTGMTSRTGFSGWWGAACGLLAAVAAMGIGQLLAGFTVPAASPVVAVGEAAIDHTPLAVKDWATSTFGTADKTVLLAGVLVVVLLYSVVLGVLAMRRLAVGFAGLVIFAGLGLAAALTRHGATGSYAVPTVFGAAAGALALWWLIVTARAAARAAGAARAARAPRHAAGYRPADYGPAGADGSLDRDGAGWSDEVTGPDRTQGPDEDASLGWVAAGGQAPGGPGPGGPGPGGTGPFRAGPPVAGPLETGSAGSTARRRFLAAAGVSVAAAAVGEIGGRSLSTSKNVSRAQAALRFPRAAAPVPPLPRGVNLPVPGLSSFITPDSQFYRVDTAIIVPQVDPANWQLRIHGMVAREVTITFDELLRQPLIEDYITLCCVSNPVGGPYIGNAKWLGASLAALIRSARPQAGADQLLCTSVDGFTSGTPLQVVLDGRDALLAVAMNGTALPTAHGFPARLVVPGLYGYVSATKWVVDIEVTTFAAAQAYWVPRGWSQLGPIKTESRIDVPGNGTTVKPGKTAVAGVAWAQHKGIDAVEVRVDHGPWHEATLAAVPGIDTWRQWVWEWDATSGTHLIEARATDKTGYTQTSALADVAPNGATGYPSTQIAVS
jgi:DMSO/TMAO reductase YedYZ molybdopterin-dependent catalytic subunit